MTRSFFITSSGTGIGKTLITTALAWQLKQSGKTVAALKPVASGYDANDPQSDTALILKCSNAAGVDDVSPWRYGAPLSPNIAAAREGKNIDMDALVEFCHKPRNADIVLAEGVGGVMVPLTDRHSVLDWMERLGWPVILVGGTYLGALSHTLTAAEAVRLRGLKLQALIVSESESGAMSLSETAQTLKKFLPEGVHVVQLPRLAPGDELWKHAPLIGRICDE